MDAPKDNQPSISEDNPDPFKIRVKLLSNETFDFEVDNQMLVRDFKHHISSHVNVPVERMRIVFAGRQLVDDKPLSDFVSETGMTVHLIARSAESVQQSQSQGQSQPSQQNGNQQQQQQQQQAPNPFEGIMGMVNSMLGVPPGQGGQVPQMQMAFGNLGNLMGNFRVPQPQTQPPQQRPQPAQQSSTNAQSSSNQGQQRESSRNSEQAQSSSNPDNRQQSSQQSSQQSEQRIHYGPISHLSQHLAHLNLPLDNVLTS